MSNDDERQALLASMYDNDGEPVDSGSRQPLGQPNHNVNTAMNMVQLTAYVRRLEKTVEEQGRRIRHLEGIVQRVSHSLRNTQTTVRTELDQKINRRDF